MADTKSLTFSASEQTLILAVFSQLATIKIDNSKLAQKLGSNEKAAGLRWWRFQRKYLRREGEKEGNTNEKVKKEKEPIIKQEPVDPSLNATTSESTCGGAEETDDEVVYVKQERGEESI